MRRFLAVCGAFAMAALYAGRGGEGEIPSADAPAPGAVGARRPVPAVVDTARPEGSARPGPGPLPVVTRHTDVSETPTSRTPSASPAEERGERRALVAAPPAELGVLGVETRGGADGEPFLRVWPSPRAARVVLSWQGREIARRAVPQRPTAAERTVSFALAASDAPRTLWIGEENAAGERSPWKRIDLFEGGGTWEGR